MIDDFSIEQYKEKDIPGILRLFSISFHKDASKDWFFWKYQGSPWASRGYVVVHKGKTVAFYGGVRLKFSFKGRILWSYQFCDVMTHPEYRGRLICKTPLIVRLGEMFYRDNPMDFAFGFPSLRHAKLQSLRLGGEGYRLVRMYKKEHLKGYSILWKLKVSEGWEFFRKEELIKFCNPPLPPFSKGGEGGLSVKNTLQLVKDERYIRWRYIENPAKKYRLLAFKRMSRTTGYVIFTIEDNWFNVLEILYEKEKDLQDILVALEAYVVKNMTSVKGIRMWFHPMEPVTGYLNRLGYNSEDSIPIAFRSVNTKCGVTSEIFYSRYFYRMGDYDAS